MSLEEKMRLIMALDDLINRKIKGNAKYYASKLGISRSTFFRLLDYMRDEFNAPLVHDKVKNRYVYYKDGVMYFGFLPDELIPSKNLKQIRHGSILSNSMNDPKKNNGVSTGGTDHR